MFTMEHLEPVLRAFPKVFEAYDPDFVLEMLNDRSNVTINAPRALVAVELCGRFSACRIILKYHQA